MLIEFKGAINSNGLCSFQQVCNDAERFDAPEAGQEQIQFWAVLEAEAATRVLRELIRGSRIRAMQLLDELAVSMGSQPNQ